MLGVSQTLWLIWDRNKCFVFPLPLMFILYIPPPPPTLMFILYIFPLALSLMFILYTRGNMTMHWMGSSQEHTEFFCFTRNVSPTQDRFFLMSGTRTENMFFSDTVQLWIDTGHPCLKWTNALFKPYRTQTNIAVRSIVFSFKLYVVSEHVVISHAAL